MIVLDTNVISELMRGQPDASVLAWLDSQPAESLWTTSVCVFELYMGLYLLPEGHRRRGMEQSLHQVMEEDIAGRVLVFDMQAAKTSAALAAKCRAKGRPIEPRDLFIAGTTAARKATLATRNTKHFQDVGIALVNPWAEVT